MSHLSDSDKAALFNQVTTHNAASGNQPAH
jgi:hypothetical protein